MAFLEVRNLRKVYKSKFGQEVEALRSVNFTASEGEFIAIMGDSGSGKTTLLNILASLDRQTAGEVIIAGNDTRHIDDKALADFRRDRLGFVFQDIKLLDTLSLRDNIYLPLVLAKRPIKEIEDRANWLCSQMGILDLLDKYPFELSGGQKQRGAIARALMNNPDLLLADEPTGQLDSHTSAEILNIFTNFHAQGQTILMVTHSVKAAAYASRVLFIRDGNIFSELWKEGRSNLEQVEEISRHMMQASTRTNSTAKAQVRANTGGQPRIQSTVRK